MLQLSAFCCSPLPPEAGRTRRPLRAVPFCRTQDLTVSWKEERNKKTHAAELLYPLHKPAEGSFKCGKEEANSKMTAVVAKSDTQKSENAQAFETRNAALGGHVSLGRRVVRGLRGYCALELRSTTFVRDLTLLLHFRQVCPPTCNKCEAEDHCTECTSSSFSVRWSHPGAGASLMGCCW